MAGTAISLRLCDKKGKMARTLVVWALSFLAISAFAVKTDAERFESDGMNASQTVESFGEAGGVRILFIGNSITLHAVAPQIGWTNFCGMAATCAERDYVHIVTRSIERNTGRKAMVKVENAASFERNFKGFNVAVEYKDLVAFRPDYVIIALGENVGHLNGGGDEDAFRQAFSNLVDLFWGNESHPQMVIRGVFWRNKLKDRLMRAVAQERGIPFVSADFSDDPGMVAGKSFWHKGVGNHPSDAGMEQIAATILTRLFPGGKTRVARTVLPVSDGHCLNPDFHTLHPFNDDYEVWIGGEKAEVRASYESRVPYNRPWPGRQRPVDQSELASFMALEGCGPVSVKVVPKHPFRQVCVRPLSAGVVPVVENGVITFNLPKNGYYVCEVDGSSRALQLFYEYPRESPLSGRRTDYYYGPGMHIVGVVQLKSHDRVYVDRDATVFGCFSGKDVEDVVIEGHGIIDGRCVERVFEGCYSTLQPSCVRFHHSKNIVVDGPVIMDAPCWAMSFFDCEDVVVRHVKICGQWRYNTDGIDVCNSRRVRICDSYVRSFDDTISIKGVPPYRDKSVEDVCVERCVLWCGWGKTVEPGIETWAKCFRHITIRDCDLIHNSSCALNMSVGGDALLEDFLFDDIRVEMQLRKRQVLQKGEGETYESVTGKLVCPGLLCMNNTRCPFEGMPEKLGCIRNFVARNISVTTEDECGPPWISISPMRNEHFTNIVLENFSLNGRKAGPEDFDYKATCPVEWR